MADLLAETAAFADLLQARRNPPHHPLVAPTLRGPRQSG